MVQLQDAEHHTARLDIQAVDGSAATYTPAELEGFETYRLETKTPWREQPAVFEGVLLRDVLQAHGMADLPKVRIVAEDGYSTTIERIIWNTAPILIATRVNGQPLSRRERGPLLIVIPENAFEQHDFISPRHLVWMVAAIRPDT